MARNTSILLGEYFDNFISAKISSGKYNSASEVIRTALRLLEEEELKTRLEFSVLLGNKIKSFIDYLKTSKYKTKPVSKD